MKANLRQLLADGKLREQPTGPTEIAALWAVVNRDLADACVQGVSADRRFATAYNAALQLATVVLRAEGLRTKGTGHHHTTLIALPLILGAGVRDTANYLDACRSKRNTVDYDGIGATSERDVIELLAECQQLRCSVTDWLEREHPDLIT
jgi:hypothetical protein